MEINDEIVDKISRLTKLSFSKEDKKNIKQDMNKMLSFIDKLNELDTEGVEPLIHMSEEVNILRKDESFVSISQEEALRNSPKKDSTYFKIPKVLNV